MIRTLALALGVLACTAQAASISGTVRNDTAAPLGNMEVTAWSEGAKGWTKQATATTDGAGNYTLTVAAGTYKLHARMGAGVSGNYGDRWYDVAPPTSNGYIGTDADEIAVAATDALTGFDFVLEVFGGADGTVLINGSPAGGVAVRMEQAAEPRIHHNDFSQPSPHAGQFFLRGLPPAVDYRVLAHELSGNYETLVMAGPYTINAGGGAPLALGNLNMTPVTPDPLEPNNVATQTGGPVDSAGLHASPPVGYTSAGALIGPRNTGDTDWYCFDAQAGDRFILSAASMLDINNVARENPFVDPVLAVFDTAGNKLFEDDDTGPLTRDARIDTGILTTTQRLCAVVSTFGDTAYDGTNQGSAGRYTLNIDMGNRKPSLLVSSNGQPAPVPPSVITIDEGQTITLDLTFTDIDNDALTVTVTQEDNIGGAVTNGTYTPGTGTGTYTWTADQQAAVKSPYTVHVTVADAEFTLSTDVIIQVNRVNLTPSTPTLVSPADMLTLNTKTPSLTLQNSTDGDLDPLSYEFELYYGAATTADQTQLVTEGSGGETSFTPAIIPENTHARWRARAFDGDANNGYSPWTSEWAFFVDTQNDPPEAPVLTKPADGEVVAIRRPSLAADNPVDPEDDGIVLFFELSPDTSFASATVSAAIPANTAGNSTTWTAPADLPWGSTWYARVKAQDSRGGVSPYSNVNQFQIKTNTPPGVPGLGKPFDAQCGGLVVKDSKVQSIEVLPVTDPEGEPVSLQLRLFKYADDPNSVQPLYNDTLNQPADGSPAVFDVSAVQYQEDTHYRVRARAFDGVDYSEWAECDFTIDAQAGGAEGADGGTGGDGGVKEGCGCASGGQTSAMLLAGLAFIVLARSRRRAAR